MSESKDESVAGYEMSLISLLVFALVGAVVTVVFACFATSSKTALATLGLMSGGAAALVGGLVGFLFGVPHTKEGHENASAVLSSTDRLRTLADPMPSSSAYRANTSLEQISDWLSKIIVGVGLVEIKQVPRTVQGAGKYLARGFEASNGVEALFVAILIYFFVCGFVFGFLWARIYLRKWFAEADSGQVAKLGNKVNELEARYMNDAKALHVIAQQLQRSSNDTKISEDEIIALVKGASTGIKMQLFDVAKRASDATDAQDYSLRNDTAASIFRGLIASDEEGQFHRNYSELSYVLSRRKPQPLVEALNNISAAISVRDRCGLRGWKYYEVRRARYQIHLDEAFKAGRPSSQDTILKIVADLNVARSEPENWSRWLRENPDFEKWMTLNHIQQ